MSIAIAEDLEPLQIITFQGVDVHGRRIVRVVGKFFPGAYSSYPNLLFLLIQTLEFKSGEMAESFNWNIEVKLSA